MKRLHHLFFPVLMCFVLLSCSKDREDTEVSNTLKNGTWRITEFIHVDRDETDVYKSYRVSFTEQETVSASGINFFVGKWRITTNGDLQMEWGNTHWFDRFNATWHITNYNDQMIQLDIVGGTDHLVFEKIQ